MSRAGDARRTHEQVCSGGEVKSMERWLGRFSEVAYALLRVVAGFLFACHGWQKLIGPLGKVTAEEAAKQAAKGPPEPLMVLAGVIELGGGILIAIGLLTGFAAFLASGTMAFAYFIGHAIPAYSKTHVLNDLLPIVNKGELAVLYCFVFLYMATRGSGRYGLDALIFRRRR
jgi:putative oxidoreductase